MLLHGLFGALSNFADLINHFKARYKVVVPLLPLYEMPVPMANLENLTDYVHEFINFKGFNSVVLLGNSLGGHISLKYVVKHPERVAAMVLTGSSGLFENSLGDTYPRRGDYEYIKQKTQLTFYDPNLATQDLIDEVVDIINQREKIIRVLSIAKSAIRNNMKDELAHIQVPVLLIWGRQDTITPPFVADDFHEHLPNSELAFIDECGHAPMMEKPAEFNQLLEQFLNKITVAQPQS